MNSRIPLALFFLLSLIVVSSFAQKAVYKENFIEGNYLLLEKNYPTALKNFLAAYEIDSTNANINYKVGLCYLNSVSEKSKALYYLEKAASNTTRNYDENDPGIKKAPEIALYYLAQAYHLQYKFKEANEFNNRFKDIVGNRNPELTRSIEKQIEENYNALEFSRNEANVTIVNLGENINSSYPDYSPVISADESVLIFTSRREGGTGLEMTMDNQYFEDIYVSYKGDDGTWGAAFPIGININTSTNEASIALSADGQQLFIYMDSNGGDIYYSILEGNDWSFPQPMGSDINTEAWEPSGCLSADGNVFYFVSDRVGGFGGRDLYRCVKLPNGQWSKALNLGPVVNTPYDEDAPFIHPDGTTLFFSSKGHKNMGGFDVFYSSRNEEGQWTIPGNLGSPVNSPDDDIFYVLSTDGKRAYYSSVKSGGLGEKDIYQITFEDAIVEAVTLLKGNLTFNGTDKIPADVHITVTDVESGLLVQNIKPNSKTGRYIITLSPGVHGKTYTINYEAGGYLPVTESITVEPSSAYREIEKALDLNPINFESKTLGTIAITGIIKNMENMPISEAHVIIKNNKTGQLVEKYTADPKTGQYYFILGRGENYNLSYEAPGYLFHSENINVAREPEYSKLERNIFLAPLKAGAKVVLKNVFFDSNKSILRDESAVELEKLFNFMNENKMLIIEVSGHTDSKGKDEVNLKLSQKRAQAVVDYLLKKGIDKSRLIAKGYGETVPIASNVLPNGAPDMSGMQLNRRVELKVVESKK